MFSRGLRVRRRGVAGPRRPSRPKTARSISEAFIGFITDGDSGNGLVPGQHRLVHDLAGALERRGLVGRLFDGRRGHQHTVAGQQRDGRFADPLGELGADDRPTRPRRRTR